MHEIYRLHGVCLLVDVALPGQMHFNRYEKNNQDKSKFVYSVHVEL